MKKIVYLISCVLAVSCSNPSKQEEKKFHLSEKKSEAVFFRDANYDLYSAGMDSKGLLILFPGFGGNAQRIHTEFNILKIAEEKQVSVLCMNYGNKLYMSEIEKKELEEKLGSIVEKHDLNTENLYLGGFSSGGIVSLNIGNYMSGDHKDLSPKGVFMIDAPVDLYQSYEIMLRDLNQDFPDWRLEEPRYFTELLETEFGTGKKLQNTLEKLSSYTIGTDNIDNIKNLRDVKLRLYSEPDTAWWRENRWVDYEGMNAYQLEILNQSLQNKGWKNMEYIQTEKRGYRSDGSRHPHSWSIVDEQDLMNWILEN